MEVIYDPVAANDNIVGVLEVKTERVAVDLVALHERVVHRLKQDAIGAMTPVGMKPVAAKHNALRIHQGRTRAILGKCVFFEGVVVGVHVVQSIPDTHDRIATHHRGVGE